MRSAEKLLEFDRLKDIVSRYTTCAPGRRATLGLQIRQDAEALDAEFALVREGVEYFRAGSEFGFGSLADPEAWLARLAIPGRCLSSAELLDAASLMDTRVRCSKRSKARRRNIPGLPERGSAGGFSASFDGDSARGAAEWRNQRRCVAAAEAHSREHRAGARKNPAVAGSDSARARRAGRRRLRHAAQRSFRDSGSRLRPAGVPGVVHAASATGQTVFVEPLEAIDLNNRLVQLERRRNCGDRAHSRRVDRARARRARAARSRGRAVDRALGFDFCAGAVRARIRLRDAGICGGEFIASGWRREIRCSKRRCARRDAKQCRCRWRWAAERR